MKKIIFNKYSLIIGTMIFVLIFAFLISEIYKRTLDDTKKDHQQQQLEMSKSAAQGINYLLDNIFNDLKFLANYANIKKEESNFPDYFLSTYEPSLVRSIFITDENTKISNSTGEHFPDWAIPYLEEIMKTTIIATGADNYLLSPVIRDESFEENTDLYFLMLVPIISEPKNNYHSLTKYIGYFISFNSLVERFIKPLRLGKSDFAWVIDGTGRLIYHPNHEEMLFRSISDTTSDCNSCHTSFDVPRSMIKAEYPSIGEYEIIGDEPPKIMAYFPIDLQGQIWILVISTLLPEVTASLRERFKLFFILGFVILGVIIFFSILVYYLNSKRIRAEEARRNLEEIQEYQEQLNQASKMASIGELVDTVAHELNTPAGIIAAHTDAILLMNDPSADITDTLNVIKRQTRRISDYTRRLLNYSQSMPFNLEPTELETLINECVFLLNHRFRAKKISIKNNIELRQTQVFVDRRQMEQVLINLLNNSVDAVESGGEITISLKKINVSSFSDEDQMKEKVLISIKDNGIGISQEHLAKIFNPFFSTKSKLKGTGLGLAISKAIIARHKGKIEVMSKQGEGTIFTIFLPLNDKGHNKKI
jgi:two-component system NtrC family sensor kinase